MCDLQPGVGGWLAKWSDQQFCTALPASRHHIYTLLMTAGIAWAAELTAQLLGWHQNPLFIGLVQFGFIMPVMELATAQRNSVLSEDVTAVIEALALAAPTLKSLSQLEGLSMLDTAETADLRRLARALQGKLHHMQHASFPWWPALALCLFILLGG